MRHTSVAAVVEARGRKQALPAGAGAQLRPAVFIAIALPCRRIRCRPCVSSQIV